MIPFESLDQAWETWKAEKGNPPKLLYINQDKFEELLATGKVKYYPDGHPYFRVHTRIVVWAVEYLELLTQMDESIERLKNGEVDLQ